MTAVLLPFSSNSLPDGTQTDISVVKIKPIIERMKERINQSNEGMAKWEITQLAEFLDVQRNPRAYRLCQDMAADAGADDALLALLGKSACDQERRMLWETIAMLAFNHAELQKRVVFNAKFHQCLQKDLAPGSGCIFKHLATMQALMSVAPCFEGHILLAPLLPRVVGLAAGDWYPGYRAISLLAVEVLVNITANPEARPHVAASFSSSTLKNLVAHVKTSEKKDDPFALAMLLANLGSHSTEDGRGCLGSALDWVPFKDFNIFDDIAGAVEASLKKCDWPPGSNAFHSVHRLASLVSALASAPLMQALYSAELAALVQPMIRVVRASSDDVVIGMACLALKELARFPNNFGSITGDSTFMELLVELRDKDGIQESNKLIMYLHEYQDKIIISGGGVLWRPTELFAHAAKQTSSVEWRMPFCKLEVVRDHVHTEVHDLCEEVDVSSHRCSEILGVLPQIPQEEVLQAMASWPDARFLDVADAEKRLSTLVEYCEGDHCYAAGHRGKATECTISKLRMVVQLIHGKNSNSKLPILLLLAAHGGVCNVQKVVGIDAAYAQLTRTYAEHAEKTSFQACVLRLLREKREHVVEQLAVEYCKRKHNFINTHWLVPFRNLLAESVGIQQIQDAHGAQVAEDEVSEYRMRFWVLYSLEVIVAEVGAALSSVPRRIPYDSFISWMQENAPPGEDVYSFLSASFDVNGNILPTAIHYALCRLGVLRNAAEVTFCGPEALVVQQGAQTWQGLDAYMRLAQVWNFSSDAEACCEIIAELSAAIHGLDGKDESDDESQSLCNLRTVLAKFEGHIASDPSSTSTAQDWLIAGVLINKDLSSVVSVLVRKEFPRLVALLNEARRHLKRN